MKRLCFTPDNFRSFCEGKKDVTRRLVKPQPPTESRLIHDGDKDEYFFFSCGERKTVKPYYEPCERVRVVTRWAAEILYDAMRPKEISDKHSWIWIGDIEENEDKPYLKGKWRPARFLPLHLEHHFPEAEIVSIRTERLQDITNEDAIMEGILETPREPGFACWSTYGMRNYYATPREAYAALWDSIYKIKWTENPWVFRYEMTIMK
jgi:hypothetical protein